MIQETAEETAKESTNGANRKSFKGGAYVVRKACKDPLDSVCRIYSTFGNIWRYRTFLYLYEHPKKEASPSEILLAIGAPSYYVTQWGLKILESNGLVETKGKRDKFKYFGLTEKGVWIADVLSQINELAYVQEGQADAT